MSAAAVNVAVVGATGAVGQEFINVRATNPSWEKWGPRNPTSPHWYDETRLQRYLAAHVARDRDLGQHRTVREFIAEFRGLSATTVQRKVLAEIERKLKDYGLQKVIPDDNLLGVRNSTAAKSCVKNSRKWRASSRRVKLRCPKT